MNIQELVDLTHEVVITRAKWVLKAECYLNRISANNRDYAELQRQEREINQRHASEIAELTLATMPEYAISRLTEQDPASGETKYLSPEQMTGNREDIEKRIAELTEKLKAREPAIDANRAERIKYLVKAWDATEGEDNHPMPIEPDTMLRVFPSVFIAQILEQIEGAVLGPLAPTQTSTTS